MRHLSTFFMLAALLAVLAPSAQAQPTAGQFARMVVIKPKPGQAVNVTAGYERHLVWHKNNKDPWTWHGWTFVLGDRIGQFMDGAFERAVAQLAATAGDPRVSWYKLRIGAVRCINTS